MQSDTDRYKGKPLLRLLECYVLWSIGQLPEENAQLLEGMTPKLQQTYNAKGTWQEIIATVMDLPEDTPEQIRKLWMRNAQAASSKSVEFPPDRFAIAFVDQNWVR